MSQSVVVGRRAPAAAALSILRRRHRVHRTISQWISADAVVIDTETTGLDGLVVEFAAVDLRTSQILVDTLINPRAPIDPAAAAVHGLRQCDLANAPTLAEIASDLRAALSGRPIVAYNADFDRRVLDRHCRTAGVEPLSADSQWHCLMKLRAHHNAELRWRRLDGGHRAASDCLAAVALAHQLRRSWVLV